MKLYQQLAQLVGAYIRCTDGNSTPENKEWAGKHRERIEALVKAHMPSGAGFDSGTSLDVSASHEDHLTFKTAFHHMNSDGFYMGWTEHKITVRPSLAFDFRITVSGRNVNGIKDLIAECFETALDQEVE